MAKAVNMCPGQRVVYMDNLQGRGGAKDDGGPIICNGDCRMLYYVVGPIGEEVQGLWCQVNGITNAMATNLCFRFYKIVSGSVVTAPGNLAATDFIGAVGAVSGTKTCAVKWLKATLNVSGDVHDVMANRYLPPGSVVACHVTVVGGDTAHTPTDNRGFVGMVLRQRGGGDIFSSMVATSVT